VQQKHGDKMNYLTHCVIRFDTASQSNRLKETVMKATWSRRSLLIATAVLAAAGPAVAADAYPSKPIKLVVGFPPGGPTDIIGRVIAQSIAKLLGESVVIENRGGAGGIIGAAYVAKAKPDGYNLLLAVESSQTRGLALNPSLSYDQQKEFTYIRKVAKQPTLILVHPALPVKSVRELIDYAKANPGKLNEGGTFGATSHIGGALFDALHGTKMTFVNYAGGSQPITDLMAGTLQVGFFTEATVAQFVKAGKLKALAIAGPDRSLAFPNLPTIVEGGGKPMDLAPWFGIAGPAGLPADVVKKLGAALDKMVADPEYLAQLEALGALPIKGTTSEAYTKEVGEEIVFWNKWAKDQTAPLAR
jgi:tripartite-type tricarboxylate transporter receptor subunit TctC